MRAFSLSLLFAVFFLALATAVPVGEENQVDDASAFEPRVEQGADPGTRFRRVTCDLMSFGGKVNHSACAAHCLAMVWKGYRGGYCENGVCHCRK